MLQLNHPEVCEESDMGAKCVQRAAASVLLAGVCAISNAVELSPDGRGDVVILPIFAATTDNATLITINNTDRLVSHAVRVRLHDRDGEVLRAFNLYLNAYDSWGAAILRVGEEVRLQVAADSCALEAGENGVASLPASSPVGSPFGFVEVYDLGRIGSPFPGPGQGLPEIQSRDCHALADLINTQGWSSEPNHQIYAPNGAVRASASIINVEKGSLYSIAGTALRDFSSVPLHTLPDDPEPSLASANDPDSVDGSTRALVCDVDGCEYQRFGNPLDAVSAVLLAHELYGDIVTSPTLGAKSEMVLTFPLRHLYPEDSPMRSAQITSVNLARDQPISPYETCFGGVPQQSDFCMTTGLNDGFHLQRSVEVASFNSTVQQLGQTLSSPILGMDYRVEFPRVNGLPIPHYGMTRMGMETYGEPTLQSTTGRLFYGRPVVGTMLQEVTNANLQSIEGIQQRANYGGAFAAERSQRQ